mgnify:CR=1 FL=1
MGLPEFWEQMCHSPMLMVSTVLTLGVILVNGWTDAPNAIATCVSTRAISARKAIVMAAVFNFLGVLVMTAVNASVAMTIYNMVDFGGNAHISLVALCAAMAAIVIWATAAWYFGIPTSESHALIAGISGAAVAIQNSFSGIVGGISVLFKPIVWLLSVSTNAVLRMLGIDPNETEEQICEEDIRMMIETGGETGAIDKDEQNFIQNVFEFDDLSVGEILTHRTDLTMLWLEDTDETWEKVICNSSFSRYPVCDGSPDRVVGVLNAKIYLREKDKSRDNIMCSALEPAYFVPETVKADVLFRNMKQTHNTFAVVLDEYGGLTGVVTIQDLIEELVGELQENPSISETAEPQIRQLDCDTWEISGNAELDEIERAIGVTFDTEYINTFTGYIFDRLKGIPDDGKTNIELKLDNISVTIKEIKDHQVVLAEIKIIDYSAENETQK